MKSISIAELEQIKEIQPEEITLSAAQLHTLQYIKSGCTDITIIAAAIDVSVNTCVCMLQRMLYKYRRHVMVLSDK